MVAKDVDDPVGDIALRDAVERQPHPGVERHVVRRKIDGAPTDEPEGALDRSRFGPFRRGGGIGEEVCGVEIPQGLDGRIEGAAAEPGQV
jgi:hypothetical protein